MDKSATGPVTECAKSTSKSSVKANGKAKDTQQFDGKTKKVLFTTITDQGSEPHQLPDEVPEVPNYFSFMINMLPSDSSTNQVLYMDSTSLCGYMVLDAACQRMCCGATWLDEHTKILAQHRLRPRLVDASEAFQFGRGSPIRAKARAYLPSSVGGVYSLLGASIVETGVPLLASNTFLETVGAIVDLGKQLVLFQNLGVTVAIHKVNGHLAVPICDFEICASQHDIWKFLSSPHIWTCPHPEIIAEGILDQQYLRPEDTSGVFTVQDASSDTTIMACELASGSAHDPPPRDAGTPCDVKSNSIWPGTKILADSPGQGGTGRDGKSCGSGHDQAVEGRGSMLAPSVDQVRQCPRSLRKVHSMPHEDEVVTGRRNMVSSWTGIFGKIFFAASIVFKYLSTEAQEQAYVGTTTRSFTEGTPETEVLPELFSDAFSRQYESSTTDLAPGICTIKWRTNSSSMVGIWTTTRIRSEPPWKVR